MGTIDQVPSTVSAIKVDGRRAHERVRAGEEFELESRSIRVDSIEVHEIREAEAGIDLDVSVRCSSGTYIRSIARDLGERLQTGGHLTALRRTAVGPFALDGARTLEQLSEDLALLPMAEAARAAFPAYELDEAQAVDVSFGRKLSLDLGRPGPVAMFDPGRRVPGALRARGGPGRIPGAGGRGLRLIRTPVVFTPCESGVPWTTYRPTSAGPS